MNNFHLARCSANINMIDERFIYEVFSSICFECMLPLTTIIYYEYYEYIHFQNNNNNNHYSDYLVELLNIKFSIIIS